MHQDLHRYGALLLLSPRGARPLGLYPSPHGPQSATAGQGSTDEKQRGWVGRGLLGPVRRAQALRHRPRPRPTHPPLFRAPLGAHSQDRGIINLGRFTELSGGPLRSKSAAPWSMGRGPVPIGTARPNPGRRRRYYVAGAPRGTSAWVSRGGVGPVGPTDPREEYRARRLIIPSPAMRGSGSSVKGYAEGPPPGGVGDGPWRACRSESGGRGRG